MAALDRTFALAQIDHIAMLIAEYLDFDMAWLLDKFLDKHAVIAKAGKSFALGGIKAFAHVFFRPCKPHTFTAAACSGFHHLGIADIRGHAYSSFVCTKHSHSSVTEC